ncbi:MAG: hypothetical protein M1825_001570 [Sarcosagium campestre]|nr:MAG: hypothetical protein M1825_001570 [Sarcosagium campestre]
MRAFVRAPTPLGLLRLSRSPLRFQSIRFTYCQPPSRKTYSTSFPKDDAEYFPSPLNSESTDFTWSNFSDRCTLNIHAGAGGHGCVSFLREKFISEGPANGGDGGSGGNIYIQAVRGETSLHRLARRGQLRAGRGKNGRGRGKGGERGQDLLLQVPLGTVVREVARFDPVEEEERRQLLSAGSADPKVVGSTTEEGEKYKDQRSKWRRDDWILYPRTLPSELVTPDFPALPRPRRSNITAAQLPSPIDLDLSEPMEQPLLLAAGAMGGLGNPHFVTKSIPRPKFATRGNVGMQLTLELELKLLADVGLVGAPNAGKSTLLRALTRSRARVGDWAFTTIQPNIGTVVLDDSTGRPRIPSKGPHGEMRTSFTIADIPGLIEDAHLDKGLGLGFLRHIERARILIFVVDLSESDPVAALKSLWREVREYGAPSAESASEHRLVDWSPLGAESPAIERRQEAPDASTSSKPRTISLRPCSISSKPWFVVATKADSAETEDRFKQLCTYLETVSKWSSSHPAQLPSTWRGVIPAIPVSALRGEGCERIEQWTVHLLDQLDRDKTSPAVDI